MVEKQMPENPPAFPVAVPTGFQFAHDGMTLRDWFAGQVVVEAFAHARANVDKGSAIGVLPEEWAAQIAYSIADALLLARSQSLPNTHTDGGR